MERIASKENAKIKTFIKLLSTRDYRCETGCFVCDGVRLCLQAAESGVAVMQFFATAEALLKHQSEAKRILDVAVESFEITGQIAQKMSAQKTPQGFFCICRRQQPVLPAETIKSGGRYVVIHDLQDPGNIGTIIRTAQVLGADGVFLSQNCPDIFSPKLLSSSMGGVFEHNIVCYESFGELAELLKAAGVPTVAFALSDEAREVVRCNFSTGGAVVIGNEGSGLPDDVIALCSTTAIIPMKGNPGSLNAAAAAAIAIWELVGRGS